MAWDKFACWKPSLPLTFSNLLNVWTQWFSCLNCVTETVCCTGQQALCPPSAWCHRLSTSSPSSHMTRRFLMISLTPSSFRTLLPAAGVISKSSLCTAVHLIIPFPPSWAQLQTYQILFASRLTKVFQDFPPVSFSSSF